MTVQTTFSVQIGVASDGGEVSAEVDARPLPDGLNAKNLGKTSDFNLNETIRILCYIPKDFVSVEIYWNYEDTESRGGFFKEDLTTPFVWVEMQDTLEFKNGAKSATLSKLSDRNFSLCKWLGTELGQLTLDEDDSKTVTLPEEMNTEKKYGLAVVTYEVKAKVLSLQLPPLAIMKEFGSPPYDVKGIILVKTKTDLTTKKSLCSK